jgi:hypothetical protein
MKVINSKKDIHMVNNAVLRGVVEEIADRGQFEGRSYVVIVMKDDDPEDIRLVANRLDLTDPPYKTEYRFEADKRVLRMTMKCNDNCTAHFLLTGDNIYKVVE